MAVVFTLILNTHQRSALAPELEVLAAEQLLQLVLGGLVRGVLLLEHLNELQQVHVVSRSFLRRRLQHRRHTVQQRAVFEFLGLNRFEVRLELLVVLHLRLQTCLPLVVGLVPLLLPLLLGLARKIVPLALRVIEVGLKLGLGLRELLLLSADVLEVALLPLLTELLVLLLHLADHRVVLCVPVLDGLLQALLVLLVLLRLLLSKVGNLLLEVRYLRGTLLLHLFQVVLDLRQLRLQLLALGLKLLLAVHARLDQRLVLLLGLDDDGLELLLVLLLLLAHLTVELGADLSALELTEEHACVLLLLLALDLALLVLNVAHELCLVHFELRVLRLPEVDFLVELLGLLLVRLNRLTKALLLALGALLTLRQILLLVAHHRQLPRESVLLFHGLVLLKACLRELVQVVEGHSVASAVLLLLGVLELADTLLLLLNLFLHGVDRRLVLLDLRLELLNHFGAVRLVQLSAHLLQLVLELDKLAPGGVLVDANGVHDLTRAGCVAERQQRLLSIVHVGRNAHEHVGLAVAAKGILKQRREVGVTVRRERLLALRRIVHERVDDALQRQQRLVDVRRLNKAVPSGTGLAHALGASQVDQVDAGLASALNGLLELLLGNRLRHLSDGDLEERVRTTGALIHFRRSDGAGGVALVDELNAALPRVDLNGRQVLHESAHGGRRADLHVLRVDLGLGVGRQRRQRPQQILRLLVVELEVPHLDAVHCDVVLALLGLDRQALEVLEETLAHAGNEARVVRGPLGAHHAVRFTGTRLAISKETAVVALPRLFQQLQTDGVENILLRRVRRPVHLLLLVGHRPEAVVEGKALLLNPRVRVLVVQKDALAVVELDDASQRLLLPRLLPFEALLVELELAGVEGTDTTHNFDVLGLWGVEGGCCGGRSWRRGSGGGNTCAANGGADHGGVNRNGTSATASRWCQGHFFDFFVAIRFQ
eukprot:PhM_4_TR11669/c0_g1_i1/m.63983